MTALWPFCREVNEKFYTALERELGGLLAQICIKTKNSGKQLTPKFKNILTNISKSH